VEGIATTNTSTGIDANLQPRFAQKSLEELGTESAIDFDTFLPILAEEEQPDPIRAYKQYKSSAECLTLTLRD
jgi:hypothetical protein